MKKIFKWLKRLLKISLLSAIVFVVFWCLGVLNWFGSLFDFLPPFPIDLGFGIGRESRMMNGQNLKGEFSEQTQAHSNTDAVDNIFADTYKELNQEDAKDSENVGEQQNVAVVPTGIPLTEASEKFNDEPMMTVWNITTPGMTVTSTVVPAAVLTATPTATPTATSTATPTATSTATPTAAPTVTPTAAPTVTPTVTPTLTPTVTSIVTVAPTVKPTITSDYDWNEDHAEATVNSTEKERPTYFPIATLKPTPEPIVITEAGKIVTFSFDDSIIDDLLEGGVAYLSDVTVEIDRRNIVVTSSNDTDFVEFTLTAKGFDRLTKAGLYTIIVPYKTISLYQIYQQIQETNTDKAEFKWFFDGSQYKYKAVIKNNFLDWLRRFPHDERFLIIE